MPPVRSSAQALPAPDALEGEAPDELARLRARIRELEQAGGRDDRFDALMSMLSHELRSPLQSLMLNVDVCMQRLRGHSEPDGEWFAEKLKRQRRLAGRLKLLIDTFLDIGQLASGPLRLEVDTLDLGELVRDVVHRATDDLAWARCECRLEITPGVTGRWDRVQVDLVISNLLTNAIKYGGGSPITVTVEGTNDAGIFTVRDGGPGIARGDQARIFEKFTRLPGPSTVGGFGLGLWIVQRIVEAAGGSIQLDSDTGRGAAFTVSLPRQGPPTRR